MIISWLFIADFKALKPPAEAEFLSSLIGVECNCPLDCEETIYNQELSQASLIDNGNLMIFLKSEDQLLGKMEMQIRNITKKLLKSPSLPPKEKMKMNKLNQTMHDIIETASVVHFYFKELGIVQYSREELFGVMDLVGKQEIWIWYYCILTL